MDFHTWGEGGGVLFLVEKTPLAAKTPFTDGFRKKVIESFLKVEDGARLYDMFCSSLAEKLGEARVMRGRFGARQILSTITNGPYSHTFDIS